MTTGEGSCTKEYAPPHASVNDRPVERSSRFGISLADPRAPLEVFTASGALVLGSAGSVRRPGPGVYLVRYANDHARREAGMVFIPAHP